MIKNIYIHERLKYIDVIYYYIKDLYEKNLIKLNYMSSANIIVDDLTKSLSKNKFKKFMTQLKFWKLIKVNWIN